MSWNYRIIKQDDFFGVRDVYYDKQGKMQLVAVENQAPHGTTLKALKADMEYFREAFNKPVVNYDDIPENGADMSVYDRNKTQ